MGEFEGTLPSTGSGSLHEDHSLREKAGDVVEQGKEKAKELGAKASERAIERADSFRGELCDRLDRFADRLEHLGDESDDQDLAQLGRLGSRAARGASGLLGRQSTEELLHRARHELRERPALVVAGMAALGFLGARLLRE